MMSLMGRWYINSFHPLVSTKFGREASQKHNLLPFIDGSIRREPDLEHPMPGISCLCRAGKFAPRLEVGDTVMYLAVKRRYGDAIAHRRLIAILRVEEALESHENAAAWYQKHRLLLPSNCMVKGNECVPIAQSHGKTPFKGIRGEVRRQRLWDRDYAKRASRYPQFRICSPKFIDCAWSAPAVSDADLLKAFGKVPGTQNPGELPQNACLTLLSLLGIPAPPTFR